MLKANFHTHTTFCDGAHRPEDVVLSAISKKFDAIGFSEHGPIDFDQISGMTPLECEDYKNTVLELKDKYRNNIKIFLGIEHDFYSDFKPEGYEYIIGSCHYVKKNDRHITVDYSRKYLLEHLEKYFDGDMYAFCESYYKALPQIVEKTGGDIIGHFDLVTKFNEAGDLIDEENPRYRRAALDALEALVPSGKIFEINTGAISRGHRTKPYPAPFLLRELSRMGAKVILSSDSHHMDTIDCAFDEALQIAESCGFTASEIDKNTREFIEMLEG